MNFGFDDEQKSLGDTVAQVLADFATLTAPDPATPRDEGVWTALSEIGLLALTVPERFGGVDLSLVDLTLAVEALGAGLAPTAAVATLAATGVLVRYGSETQQQNLLPGIATGAIRIAIAILEADQGYDPAEVRTEVVDGRLRGTKILVADAADANYLLVLARHSGKPALVLVPRGAEGITMRAHQDIDPSAAMSEVSFDLAIENGSIIAQATPGHAVAHLLDTAATLHAGLLMGLSARMLDASVEYAKTRVQFGQAIGAFQTIKHRCADMAVAVEAGRSAAYYAFWAVTEDAPDKARAASMAKAYCGDVARHVCNETIQVHGGMGFTWELGLHRFLRRSKLIEHSFGDSAYHYERVLAETLNTSAVGNERQLDAA